MRALKGRALLGLLLTCLLTACGGVDAAAIGTAAQSTIDAGGVELRMTGVTRSGQGAPAGSFSAAGTSDLSTGSLSMTVQLAVSGGDPTVVDVIRTDGEVYQRGLPGFPAEEWILVEDAPSAVNPALATFVDPVALLQLLVGLTGDVVDAGGSGSRGDDTHLYSLVLPPARVQRTVQAVVDALGDEVAAEVNDAGLILGTGDADVWLDEEGRVRHLRLGYQLSVGGGQVIPAIGAIDGEVLLDLVAVDTAPAVEPPPAAETSRATFADLYRDLPGDS